MSLAWLTTIPPHWIWIVVAVLVMIESFGVPVPGETAIVASTLWAVHGHPELSPWAVAGAAFAGAVIGDSIGFLAGRRHGPGLVAWASRRFPKLLSADHVAYAEHVFARHGAWAVFFGRFIALLRMLAGPLAGTLGMHYVHFLVANVLGAALWVGTIVGGLVVFGAVAEHWLSMGTWAVLGVLVVLAVLGGRAIDRALERRVAAYAQSRRDVA